MDLTVQTKVTTVWTLDWFITGWDYDPIKEAQFPVGLRDGSRAGEIRQRKSLPNRFFSLSLKEILHNLLHLQEHTFSDPIHYSLCIKKMASTFSGDETAPFFGFLGAAAALVFSCKQFPILGTFVNL